MTLFSKSHRFALYGYLDTKLSHPLQIHYRYAVRLIDVKKMTDEVLRPQIRARIDASPILRYAPASPHNTVVYEVSISGNFTAVVLQCTRQYALF